MTRPVPLSHQIAAIAIPHQIAITIFFTSKTSPSKTNYSHFLFLKNKSLLLKVLKSQNTQFTISSFNLFFISGDKLGDRLGDGPGDKLGNRLAHRQDTVTPSCNQCVYRRKKFANV